MDTAILDAPRPMDSRLSGVKEWAAGGLDTRGQLLRQALGFSANADLTQLNALLSQHRGSVRQLVAALLAGKVTVSGVGPARIARLAATLSLATEIAWEGLASAPLLSCPESCGAFLRQHFALFHREVFSCLLLDSRNRLLTCRDLFAGTIDGAAVYPRVVVTEALRWGANGVIAVHNHPSGCWQPSASDLRITERLRDALALVDIRLLDHIIVGHGELYSMAREGVGGF